MELEQFSSLSDKEIKNLKKIVISKFEKIKQRGKEENYDSNTFSDILNNYNGNKFDFKLTISKEKVYYRFTEVGDDIDYHSIIFTDPIGKQKSFFAKIPVEYINQDTEINSIEIGNNFHKIVGSFFNENSNEPIALGRLDTNGDNSKILIFGGLYEAVIQILLGNRTLPVRIFLNPELNSLRAANYQNWTKKRDLI